MTGTLPDNTNANAEKLKALIKSVSDMVGMLRAQRELLMQREITLPDGPLTELQSVGTDLSRLHDNLGNDQVELHQLRELARMTEILNSSLDLDLILSEVIDTVISLVKAERGYIVLRDIDTGKLDYRVARNPQQHDLNEDEFIISNTIIEHVAQTGEPVLTINAEQDERFKNAQSVYRYVLRSILCVPLKRKGTVIGVIYVDNRILPDVFTMREQRLVSAFADQAAIAIENARLFENVRASLAEITSIKDFMANIFASIASGVIAIDGADTITTMNAAAAQMLSILREGSVGKSLWAVMPSLYTGFDRVLAEVRAFNRERTVEFDTVINDHLISLSIKLSPLQDTNQITQGLTLVLNDLTELKQQRDRISLIQRYLPQTLLNKFRNLEEPELGGVEREISVLFCDVRNFTTFSEKLDPQVLMETINQYLAVSSDAINLFEGIIDKYMGDAVVGLYNTQLNPQQDHAIHAVRAAMTMVQDVLDLHDRISADHRLQYGIGVHTGVAILGNVGSPTRKEFTVIGESLQIAKLLQENAKGGEVLISQPTYDLVKDVIAAEPVTPHKTKSDVQLPPIYRVIGPLRQRD